MKLSFLILAFLSMQVSFANTMIFSDVDDTIKITDVLSKPKLIYDGLFLKKAFSGMSELYQELNSNGTQIYYISGSPTIIKEKVQKFLLFNNFPQRENLVLKKGTISTYDYKFKTIKELILKNNPDKIILIGDDTEFDPEVYDALSKEFGEKIETIYIRSIQNRKLPPNDLMKKFFSAVEIAAHELVKENVKAQALYNVATSFVAQNKSSLVAIKHRYCPTEGSLALEDLKFKIAESSEITDAIDLVQQRIVSVCKKLNE